jgi:N utilization substance protein A
MESTTLSRTELLQVADAVAREKSIEREEVLEAMEQAIGKAGRAKYGHEHDIRAEIDRKTGEIRLRRFREIVDEIENEFTQMLVDDAQVGQPGVQAGEFIVEDLPPIDLGRIAAQTAKQVIVQKVREAERQRQFEEFKDRVGEIVNGIVKRNEFGNVTVDLSRAEGLMRRDECLPREALRTGDRVRSYIYDVREETRGPQIFLSRTHPQFMAKLFAQEVPEIYDGIIEIKSVARDPGSRAKIGVLSNDSSIDPVGACVGMRGSRVQAVVSELGRIEVVVPDDQLSLAIGRRGQNVRLASQLSGWEIDIMTEDEESQRRQEDMRNRSQMFIDALDVDDVIAHLLVAEGFTSVEQVAFVPLLELSEIEGFDEEVAEELRARGRTFLEEQDRRFDEERRTLGVSDELNAVEGLTPAMLVVLGQNEIKTLDDLGDLASDELIEMLGDIALSAEAADATIMAARAHWFDDEDQEPAPAEDEGSPAAEPQSDEPLPGDAAPAADVEADADAKGAAEGA